MHFIGRLQSNKVRLLAGHVDVYETIDRPSLVHEVAKRAPGATVLVQVNATGEAGKGGCDPADVAGLVEACIAPGSCRRTDDGRADDRRTGGGAAGVPHAVRRLVDELGLRTCSMGMTDDLEVAVQEGSTRVRVGTALFGPRDRPRTF